MPSTIKALSILSQTESCSKYISSVYSQVCYNIDFDDDEDVFNMDDDLGDEKKIQLVKKTNKVIAE
ncbi:hypothetical protein HanRHA438_Chr15g0707041 [Helianthus annuus]|nr:hypothetical protein HanRHA438_Chr15g0707041 [Helianthus annuus]